MLLWCTNKEILHTGYAPGSTVPDFSRVSTKWLILPWPKKASIINHIVTLKKAYKNLFTSSCARSHHFKVVKQRVLYFAHWYQQWWYGSKMLTQTRASQTNRPSRKYAIIVHVSHFLLVCPGKNCPFVVIADMQKKYRVSVIHIAQCAHHITRRSFLNQ